MGVDIKQKLTDEKISSTENQKENKDDKQIQKCND